MARFSVSEITTFHQTFEEDVACYSAGDMASVAETIEALSS